MSAAPPPGLVGAVLRAPPTGKVGALLGVPPPRPSVLSATSCEDANSSCSCGSWASSDNDGAVGLLGDGGSEAPWESLAQQLEKLVDECVSSCNDQLVQLSALKIFAQSQAKLAVRDGVPAPPPPPCRGDEGCLPGDEEALARRVAADRAKGRARAASGDLALRCSGEDAAATRRAHVQDHSSTSWTLGTAAGGTGGTYVGQGSASWLRHTSPSSLPDLARGGGSSEAVQGAQRSEDEDGRPPTSRAGRATWTPGMAAALTAAAGANSGADSASMESGVSKEPSMPVIEMRDYFSTEVSSTRLGRSHTTRSLSLPPIRNGLRPWARVATTNLLNWRFFEPAMGLVVVLNAANIGWAIDRELRHQDTGVQTTSEVVFLAVFTLELCLRVFVHGFRCLKVLANAFDFVLILATMIAMVAQPLLDAVGREDLATFLEQFVILRMLRLLRLARTVRLVQSFTSLWKLVQGLWHCFGTMMSAMLLIFICMYVFACFGAEFITKQLVDDPEVGGIVATSFSTLPKIILTLCQFITMDSTASLYVPLIHRSPGLAVFFGLLLVTVTIALMNLITALLVEDAISKAQMDEEMKGHYTRKRLKALEPAMHELFHSLDDNGDGTVQIKELVDAIRTGAFHIPNELRDVISPARMLDLFEAIDADQSGGLTESELVSGLGTVALADVSLETMQTLHLLRVIKNDLKDLKRLERSKSGRGHRRASDASAVRPRRSSI